MKIIEDKKALMGFIEKYHIDQYFEDDMLSFMSLVSYERGEAILQAGNTMAYFYFIVEGKVKIYKTLENGKSVLLRISRPLSELGSVEVLLDEKVIDSNVQSIFACKAIRIPFTAINAHAKNDAKFYKYIVTRLSHKLTTCSNTASMNVTYPFKSRFASYLISISTPMNAERVNEIRFDTLTDLATFLGSSYRHLNRVIRELEADGIIKKNKKSFKILDYAQLEDLSGGYYE